MTWGVKNLQVWIKFKNSDLSLNKRFVKEFKNFQWKVTLQKFYNVVHLKTWLSRKFHEFVTWFDAPINSRKLNF
jgi:hypothetical protein